MLPPRVLFFGSYPPRECGIATFTKDVVDSFDRAFGFRAKSSRSTNRAVTCAAIRPEVVARLSEQDRL